MKNIKEFYLKEGIKTGKGNNNKKKDIAYEFLKDLLWTH